MIPILAGLAFVLLIITILLFLRGKKRFSWLEYYVKCREAGLSIPEARLLYVAAGEAGLDDPTNVLWSPQDMDKAIGVLTGGKFPAARGREGNILVDKVYELRKRLEFEKPRYKAGIKSSRQVEQGQRVRILVLGVGVFGATVIDSDGRRLIVSHPSGARLPKGFVWKGKRVSVYLWRQDDACYVFDSVVLDDLRIRNIPVLHLAHSESLLRTQKRRSVRSRTKAPAYLYILKRIEGAFEKFEKEPGLRCIVNDVSEDGFSVVIGGKAKPGIAVKAQFFLGDNQIVMSGIVKSIDYDPGQNRSLLHVEAAKPSTRTRNTIRSFVYKIRPQGGLQGAGPQS
jgi:c-di-GMP-binding flagellar brake protein YcgR